MSGTVNKVILLGNLGRDPDIRSTSTGGEIANFSLATSQQWRDKASGERRELTEWHRVVVFNPHLVKVIAQYVKKGTRLYIEGQVQTRKWTDKNGVERLSTEVVIPQFGGVMQIEGGTRERSDAPARAPTSTDQRGNPRYGGTTGGDLDDEIPF